MIDIEKAQADYEARMAKRGNHKKGQFVIHPSSADECYLPRRKGRMVGSKFFSVKHTAKDMRLHKGQLVLGSVV